MPHFPDRTYVRNLRNLYSTERHNKNETDRTKIDGALCICQSKERGSRFRETKEEERDKKLWGNPDSLILSPSLWKGPEDKI